ncbi:MAG: HlyD family efflux transporter periplasmic adaptor subunit [Eubacteriales bacterium]|nr:HlyD family efflux transporter periplasmic adaptor subunit [Eubacteriales bacterium]
MQKRKKSTKIVPYKKTSFFNIGTVMFGILFLYMIICLVLYLTSTHTTPYEVTAGSLSGNYRFTALALKTEKVVTADESGTVTYYAREGSKVGVGNSVCSIDEGGRIQELIAQNTADGSTLDNDSLSYLREKMETFTKSFSTINFQNVYNFKADLESTIMELTSEEALKNADESSNISSLLNLCTAPVEGILVLSIDGYEGKTPETVTAEDFDQKNYTKENLRLNTSVKNGEPIYKLLTEETWHLMIPLDQKTATLLADSTSVKFRFQKNGNVFYASFSILQIDGAYYGDLELENSLSSFSSDRFVEIELLLNQKTGLKIPTSAIVKKQFYKIPKEYCSYDEDNPDEVRLLRETYASDGSAVQKNITAVLYDQTDKYFLVDVSLFEEGDCVIMADSNKRFLVSEVETLVGVYNINKGYAIFREIEIIDENEEYCIVDDETAYGLAQYDRIALDASTVSDDEIVY